MTHNGDSVGTIRASLKPDFSNSAANGGQSSALAAIKRQALGHSFCHPTGGEETNRGCRETSQRSKTGQRPQQFLRSHSTRLRDHADEQQGGEKSEKDE